MEVAHTNLAKVAGMVTVHVDAVMVHATSETTTSGMLAMLANTAVTGGDVSTLLAILLISGGLYEEVISILIEVGRGGGVMDA